MMNTANNKLKAWRHANKLTMEAAARAIGISTRHYCDLETGKKKPTGEGSMATIYRVTGGAVDANWFYGLE